MFSFERDFERLGDGKIAHTMVLGVTSLAEQEAGPQELRISFALPGASKTGCTAGETNRWARTAVAYEQETPLGPW